MVPVTLADLASFLQTIILPFEDFLFMAFTLMVAFAVLFGVKHLLIGDRP